MILIRIKYYEYGPRAQAIDRAMFEPLDTNFKNTVWTLPCFGNHIKYLSNVYAEGDSEGAALAVDFLVHAGNAHARSLTA